jgi:hypothetical protein
MRAYKNVALITAIVLVALLAPGGCGVKTPAEFTSTPAGLACIEMMKKVPSSYKDSFTFWDVKTLRSDPDQALMCQVFYDQKGDFFEHWGIDGDSVDYMVHAKSVTLVKGDFDLDAIRENIPADFIRDTDYETPEAWRSPPVQDPEQDIGGGVILAEGLFIRGYNSGDLDKLLPVYKREELPVYDENAVDILERLPETLEIQFGHRSGPEGLIIEATAVVKEEAGTYRWISVYKFESPEYVASADVDEYFQRYEDSYGEVESEYAERGQPSPIHSFTLEKDGEFLEWSIIVEEEYMIAILFYG